eukprot:CAMPEP_0183529184 /NCGR_PEP_ID=MMETSP0371-20130417/23236_1 /TAXON_ID=268820 /ORGANISM="Peridinium aciculiferum, Strain PAER-2" /LENGTH=426 /DNA_ID=CAMNT_0025728897 /DNA_START=10 /DNA_END=1288 /DNA_ORIENTATION=-
MTLLTRNDHRGHMPASTLAALSGDPEATPEQLVAGPLRVDLAPAQHNGRKVGMVHGVRILLGLDDQGTVPLVVLSLRPEGLTPFPRHARLRVRPVQEVPRVYLQAGLVRAHAHADACQRRVRLEGQRQHHALPKAGPPSADDPGVVVAALRSDGAPIDVSAERLWGGKVQVGGVGNRADGTCCDEVGIHLDEAITGRYPDLMLQNRQRVVDVPVQVEVRVTCQRNDSVSVGGGVVVQLPLIVVRDRVGDLNRERAREALLPVPRHMLEGDAARAPRHDVKYLPIEPKPTSMQSVVAILVPRQRVRGALQHEGPVGDSVGHPPHRRAKVLVLQRSAVLPRVFPTKCHIDRALHLGPSREEQMSQRAPIPEEGCLKRSSSIPDGDRIVGTLGLLVATKVRRPLPAVRTAQDGGRNQNAAEPPGRPQLP